MNTVQINYKTRSRLADSLKEKKEKVGDVVAHWKRTRLLGQRSRVRFRHLLQYNDPDVLQHHCDKVENLWVDRETYPWGKTRSLKKKLSFIKFVL